MHLSGLELDRTGNLVIHDSRLGRSTTFSPDGEVLHTRRIAPISLTAGGPAIQGTASSGSPFHRTYPAFGSLLIDDEGRVWIGAYPRLDEPKRRWIIIDQSGQLAGVLDLPASYEPLDASRGRVVVLRRDVLGVEEVAVFHISGNR